MYLLPLFIHRDLGTSPPICWDKNLLLPFCYENIGREHSKILKRQTQTEHGK